MNCPSCKVNGIKTEMTEMYSLKNELIYMCLINHYHFFVKRDVQYLKQLEEMRALREIR